MRLLACVSMLLASLMIGCGGSDSGTPLAVSGATPEQEADRVLAIARDMEKQGENKKAFAAYHQIIRNFPGTPSGKAAIDRVRKAQREAMRKPRSKSK
jgi:hypothetical protein